MVGPSMRFQNYVVDYTTHKRKKRDLVVYLGVKLSTIDVEPSDILVLFPLLLL
jgi:hypothetical protein